jgi:ornithine carbamoyltransferase
MKQLLDINDLTKADIHHIWKNVAKQPAKRINGNIAWSYEGNGIRTRTSFLQAFQKLGLSYIELPNFLKTKESVQDLAGYMDPFYSMYVLRDGNHNRMADFANASKRPVINAMSSEAHPCEVLTDGYFLDSNYKSITELRILLWGPVTNVFLSWYSLSRVLGLNLTHFCPKQYHTLPDVSYVEKLTEKYDVIIIDAWPAGFSNKKYSLSVQALLELGSPILLPTPPTTTGNEVLFAPCDYDHFSGYAQKSLLLPVQETIISYLLLHT